MEITDIESFIKYFEGIRYRTLKVVNCIPEDKIDWRPREGKMTFGDIIRHLALSERYIFVGIAKFDQNDYPGLEHIPKLGYRESLDFLIKTHTESMNLLKTLNNSDLQKKVSTPDHAKISMWKWLRAMVEHEVHHRGTLYANLSLLGIKTPPIFGLEEKEVRNDKQT